MKKQAFTLAEVLIALTIIGVIAAITVPALIQRTNKQEYVTALQKTYSTLSQAANMIIAEHGSPKCSDGGWACSAEDVYNMFKKYLNDAKSCGSGTGCFEQNKDERYKFLNGGHDGDWENNSGRYKLILSGGIQIVFTGVNKTCSSWNDGSVNVCEIISADVNGYKKPNQWGKDVFSFALKENGLFPRGCDEEGYCIISSSWKGKGYGCACKVLREGRIDY